MKGKDMQGQIVQELQFYQERLKSVKVNNYVMSFLFALNIAAIVAFPVSWVTLLNVGASFHLLRNFKSITKDLVAISAYIETIKQKMEPKK